MKVLLLGGTGAMGAHLSGILSEKGDDVFVTSRTKHASANGIVYIQGNAHDKEFLGNLLESNSFDILVDFMVYSTNEFTERLDLLLSNVKQYVFLSSSRVYADNGHNPIKEDSPRHLDVCTDNEYLNTDEYALKKARQENALRDSEYKNWTIIRPYITYSETRLQLGVLEKEKWLWRALKGRTIVFSNDIATKMTTLTYGYDVSRGIAAVIGKENALGKAFHITGENSLLWKDVLETYLKVLREATGKNVKCLLIDEALNKKSVEGKWQVIKDRCYNRIFDNGNIEKYLDISDFITPQKGLEKCMRAFLANPGFQGIDYLREAYLDRLTREWARPNDFNSLKTWFKYLVFRIVYPKNKLIS